MSSGVFVALEDFSFPHENQRQSWMLRAQISDSAGQPWVARVKRGGGSDAEVRREVDASETWDGDTWVMSNYRTIGGTRYQRSSAGAVPN